MYTLVQLAVLVVVVLASARYIQGVKVTSTPAALGVAVVFSLLNWGLSWLIKFLLFLPAILTLGLGFLVMPLVVNTILLWITDKVLHVLEIEDWKALWLMSLLITGAHAVTHFVLR